MVRMLNVHLDEYNTLSWGVYEIKMPDNYKEKLVTVLDENMTFEQYDYFDVICEQLQDDETHALADGSISLDKVKDLVATAKAEVHINPDYCDEDEQYLLSYFIKVLMTSFNCQFYHSCQW